MIKYSIQLQAESQDDIVSKTSLTLSTRLETQNL